MSKHGKFVENLIKTFLSSTCTDSRDGVEDLGTNEQKQFAYKTLVAATRDFDPIFKLGQGGFGSVFKGKLKDGRLIAVKRLSQASNQGKKEFINEAKLLARVQHRNVVTLLGYCAHGKEKLLVYEYVVNDSLDKVLFNADRRRQLDWNKRYDVIVGVARGLLYLHEDTHSCIIHRDIKASNVLLDEKWIPKIADFGMARLYPEDHTHVQTRVAGTNGYVAPEYLMHGQLSVKADVYSYGVLVLELISGKKNSSFYMEPDVNSLLEWTWKLYSKGRSLEIMDPTLASTGATDQVRMCIQIALLCVQGDPKLRPSMQRVLVLLSKKHGNLEEPTRPGYHGSSYRSSTPVWSSRSGSPSHAASTFPSASASGSTSASASASASASNTHTASTSAQTRSSKQRSYEKRPIQGLLPLQMGRFDYYVVYRGRQPGIYRNWTECKAQVLGYPNAEFKGFFSLEEARVSLLNYHGSSKLIPEPLTELSAAPCRRRDGGSVRGEVLLFIIIGLLCFICFMWCFSIYFYMLSH